MFYVIYISISHVAVSGYGTYVCVCVCVCVRYICVLLCEVMYVIVSVCVSVCVHQLAYTFNIVREVTLNTKDSIQQLKTL